MANKPEKNGWMAKIKKEAKDAYNKAAKGGYLGAKAKVSSTTPRNQKKGY